jgi:hypothetical protein
MTRVDGRTTMTAVALLSVLGLNIGRQGSPPAPAPAPSVRSANRDSSGGKPAGDSRQEFLQFFASMKADREGHQFRYLIATVPDPDATALRLYTDRVIEMLTLAAFQKKFVLVDHWLPWALSLERMDEEFAKR